MSYAIRRRQRTNSVDHCSSSNSGSRIIVWSWI